MDLPFFTDQLWTTTGPGITSLIFFQTGFHPRCGLCYEKCISIKYTRHNQITLITGKPTCGATACKGNGLEFISYVSKSICIQMCNTEA